MLTSRQIALSLILVPCLSAQNMLNNGGFEQGLMCYEDYVQYVASFAPTDYSIRLSTDAHSGTYSLELNCGGTNCTDAFVDTDPIPSVGNHGYLISVYSKCPAVGVGEAVLYVQDSTGANNSVVLPCTGAWNLNTVSFQPAANATDFTPFLYHFDSGAGPAWVRYDDLKVTYADGTAPAEIVLHPGVRKSYVSGNAVLVDGSPYLALGYFDVPGSDLSAAAAAGANTVFALGTTPSANCFNTGGKSYLDRVYEAGLNFVPQSTAAVRAGPPAIFPSIMTTFAPHLANIAWMLADEPDQAYATWWLVSGSTFVAEYNAAKTQTTLPLFGDMQTASTGTASQVAPYAQGTDLWMAEPYGSDFSLVNHAIDLMSSLRQQPIWLAEDGPAPNLIVPKAYWSIAAGATGLVYYRWSIFKADPNLLAASKQVFSELGQLKNVIFSQNIDNIVIPPAGVAYQAREYDGSAYILSAYSQSTPLTGRFQVSGLAAGTSIDVMFENRTLKSAAGSFTDQFAGVSRHVYVFKANRIHKAPL